MAAILDDVTSRRTYDSKLTLIYSHGFAFSLGSVAKLGFTCDRLKSALQFLLLKVFLFHSAFVAHLSFLNLMIGLSVL